MEPFKFNGDWTFDLKLPEFSKLHSYVEYSSAQQSAHHKKLLSGYVPFKIYDERNYKPEPTPAQLKTITYLINNEKKILEGLFHAFRNTINPMHAEATGDWDLVTKLKSPADLSKIIRINDLQVYLEEKEGMSYYRMDCEYEGDPEHGLSVVMHREELIDYGGIGDIGFDGIVKDPGFVSGFVNTAAREEFGTNMIHKALEKYGKHKPWQLEATEDYFRRLFYQKQNEQIKDEIESNAWDINLRFPSLDNNLVDIAANTNNPEMINWLIEKGADYSGSITLCLGNQKKEAMECLIGHGVSIDFFGRYGTTPLRDEMINYIQAYKLRIDYQQQRRMQQYERTTERMVRHKDTVLFYLAMGANPHICDKEGNDYKAVLRKLYIPRILEKYNIIEVAEKLIEPDKQGSTMWKFWKKE